MDKIFGPGYQGDPGIPHTGSAFEGTLWGVVLATVSAFLNPHFPQYPNQYNWHDIAMASENAYRKRCLKKKKPYEPAWNQFMNREQQEAYYYNWPVYFP